MKAVIYGNSLFSHDLAWGFEQIGWESYVVSPLSEQDMDDILTRHTPNLVITLGAPLEFKRNVLAYLSKRITPEMKYVHWDTDGISSKYYTSTSGEGIEMDVIYMSKPDIVFTMCPEMLELIRGKGIVAHRLDYAFSPLRHHPDTLPNEYNGQISLLGHAYVEIVKHCPEHYRFKSLGYLVRPLLQAGYKIDFYGEANRYRNLLRILFGDDVSGEMFHDYLRYIYTYKLYSGAFINLATQNHMHTVTKRTFEILGSGGFLLSADNAAIKELFVAGKDFEASSSAEQTIEIIEFYKKNPDRYNAVCASGLEAAQKHTYKQRAEYIVSKLMT